MNQEEANNLIDRLKNGELESCHISNEDMLAFRQVLVERADFKYIRGVANRGGSVTYTYMKEPRS